MAKQQMNDLEKRTVYSYNEALEDSVKYFNGDKLSATSWINKYALKDTSKQKNEKDLVNIVLYEKSPDQMHDRISSELERIEIARGYKNPMSKDDFKEAIEGFKYVIPQGGPMSGIGNNYQIVSLSNCFVIGNNADSYGGIMAIDQEQVQLMKRRGGVGHDLSHIRPKSTSVKNSALTSTGVVPFMERYSNSTREVAQDGRRGALMLSLSVKHPDAEDFINAKLEEGKITNANVSVRIDDKFMKALRDGKMYQQQFPVESDNPEFTQEIDPKNIWEKIVHNAWKKAEPGILFWDTIIKESVPDSYADKGFKTVSTNPCGEIPLNPYDSCRLLAMNLYGFVDKPFTKEAKFNNEKFEKYISKAQRISDNIIDLEMEKIAAIKEKIISDPEADHIKATELHLWNNIEKTALQGRRMGLGITGEGDMLAALGLRYGTKAATDFSADVHKKLALGAYRSSVELAKERGAFEMFDFEKEKNNPFIQRLGKEDPQLIEDMKKYGRRNVALLTIAPTGTTSMMTQTTSGIEPAFLPVYERRRKISPNSQNANVDFEDKEGTKWEKYKVFHHHFGTWLGVNGYDIDEVKEIADQSVRDPEMQNKLDAIVKKSPYYKATSNDVNWKEKVKMQGAIQKWVDHSISVTINLPKDVKKDLVGELYMEAWKSGCKGVTVYRDGSREGVLLTGKEGKKFPKKRPKSLDAEVLRFTLQDNKNGGEKWLSFVGMLDGKPYEMFTGKSDEEVLAVPGAIKKGRIVKEKNEDESSRYDFWYTDRHGYDSHIGGISHQFKQENWNYAKMISSMLRGGMPALDIINTVSRLDEGAEGINTWKAGVVRTLNKYVPNGTVTEEVCDDCGINFHYEESCKKCGCGSKCE
jgi:ribonucleoside-diphosphate reductase alpha chain